MGRRLRPALPLGVVVLTVTLSWHRVWGCVLCDPAIVASLRDLQQNYLPSHMNVDPQVLQTLLKRLDDTVRQFSDLPVEENSYQGIIDEPTLKKMSWAFLKEIKRIKDSDLKDNLLLKELSWTLHTLKETFTRLVGEFQSKSFCPNKCGLMMQTLIWCYGCEKEVHACQKSLSCGEKEIKVPPKGDLILDCELSWHKAAEGLTDYRFYRVWPNGTETLLSQGKESTLVKPMVSLKDSGTYRCILGTIRVHNPATIFTYYVKVLTEEEGEAGFSDSGQTVSQDVVGSPSSVPTSAPTPAREVSGEATSHGPHAHSTVTHRPTGAWSTHAKTTSTPTAAESGLGAESVLCSEQGEAIFNSGQNVARILNITLIGLVAAGAAAVLGSLALTLYCARRADLHLKSCSQRPSNCSWVNPLSPE